MLESLFAILILVLVPLPAAAQDWRSEASSFDIERIDGAERVLQQAIAEARAGGSPADIAVVDGLLRPSRPIEGEALLGDWRCRTIKTGGNLLPLVVYGRISIAEDGLHFEKLTGSQRTSGYLRPEYPTSGEGLPVRYIYLGAGHYGDEKKRAYGGPSNRLGRVAQIGLDIIVAQHSINLGHIEGAVPKSHAVWHIHAPL